MAIGQQIEESIADLAVVSEERTPYGRTGMVHSETSRESKIVSVRFSECTKDNVRTKGKAGRGQSVDH